jgi:hypothetical protein
MTQVIDQAPSPTPSDTDLAAAVQRVLEASPEPLTLSKIRSHLPAAFRNIGSRELEERLARRVDANVLYQYCPYRSQHPRYWDRPMRVHVVHLLREILEDEPLTLSQVKRKLPDYARDKTEEVLRDQVAQGLIYQHPRPAGRGSELYGLQPPDPRQPLRPELTKLFGRLQQQLGFTREQLRQATLELLHDEEWGDEPAAAPAPAATPAPPAAAEQATAEPTVPHASPPDTPPAP